MALSVHVMVVILTMVVVMAEPPSLIRGQAVDEITIDLDPSMSRMQ